jgi:4-methylaminobutanoate oxidase (formaldehyde-forming)
MDRAIGRVPALASAGIKQLINGPESFTPDGNFILGEAPELRNLFVGAGFNAYGIAAGGGAGMALAEWVAAGVAPYDLWVVDIRRFGPHHRDEGWTRARTLEAYAKHYTISWPHEDYDSGRPNRVSPLYERLAERGAVFGEKFGWERPNWFADVAAGESRRDEYGFGRQNWFEAVGREHRATREAAVVIDQTSFAKFALEGRDSAAALEWICANDVDKPVGSLTYTQLLDDRGGIQCDLTVCRVAHDEYYIVTGTGFATHDFDWIQRNLGGDVSLSDVTTSWAVLSLMGPRSRAVLRTLTDADLAGPAFPFATMRTIDVAGCPVRALRITYVGELGWELHVPVEHAAHMYDELLAAGTPLGLVNAGYRAIESCRLEKGYRAWGADIGPDTTPLEAGLGWATKLSTSTAFRGRGALMAQKDAGIRKRLAAFTADPGVVLLGGETIVRDGERVGWLASGGFGYTIGRSIGYGYVRRADADPPVTVGWVTDATYELEVARERVPAEISLRPLYDPDNAKVRA